MKNVICFISLFCTLMSLASDKKTKALQDTVWRRDTSKAQSLLDGRADVNACYYGTTCLNQALVANDIAMVELLVTNKASVNVINSCRAPLQIAPIHNNIYAIQLLLEHKAGVDDTLRDSQYFIPDLSKHEQAATLVMEHDAKFNAWVHDHSHEKVETNLIKECFKRHTTGLDASPLPQDIINYRNQQLVPAIKNYMSVQVLAGLTAEYLSNADIVMSFKQTYADETVAARDRAFSDRQARLLNERKAILFMARRSSCKPSCWIY